MNIKSIKNASWIIGCRIFQSILAFVISMLTARYLGPSNYGLINYAQSITTFVAPIMHLGFNWVIVKELINYPEEEEKTLGTCITLSICSAFVCIIGILSFCAVVNVNDKTTLVVCALYSTALIFQALELIQFWFQAKYLSKYVALVSLAAYIIVSAYKSYLLITAKSVYWFAVSHSLDYCIIALSLIFFYRKLTGKRLSFSWPVAKRVLRLGKYYIFSGLMVTIFLQTDKIMLKLMIGDSALGMYSAAATCTSVASFVFAAINDSMRPFVLESKKQSTAEYERSVIQLYFCVFYSALLYALVLFAFAPNIISILFGSEYLDSTAILRVLALYTVFSYYGGAKDIWILAEGKQKYLLIINIIGAISNVFLNYFWIKAYGAIGAAWASFITQFVTNVIVVALIKPIRRNSLLLLKALNPCNLIDVIQSLKSNKTEKR